MTFLQGDALEKLRELEDESVHCCVTFPPYWGLRDYGTARHGAARWVGRKSECDHRHQRKFIGIELNPEYIANARNRLLKEVLL